MSISKCNKCGARYPSAPPDHLHKCGRCSGGMCSPEPFDDTVFAAGMALREELASWHLMGQDGNYVIYMRRERYPKIHGVQANEPSTVDTSRWIHRDQAKNFLEQKAMEAALRAIGVLPS